MTPNPQPTTPPAATMPAEKILLVDDDKNLLEGLVRSVGRTFHITTALGGQHALELMQKQTGSGGGGPFAVIITDMRMPGMDGLAFLEKARAISQQPVYMMLTGNADQLTAIEAVNRGRVFKFLNKPCTREAFMAALAAAIVEHRRRQAERDLLEKTLAGSVAALMQVLSLTQPKLFHRSSRVAQLAAWLAKEGGDPDPWQVEVAASLATIGCVALPDDLVDTVLGGAGTDVSQEQTTQFERHAITGAKLLSNIPRMERTAAIIRHQFEGKPLTEKADFVESVMHGVEMLRVAKALEVRLSAKKTWDEARTETLAEINLEHAQPRLVKLLQGPEPEWLAGLRAGRRIKIELADLQPGMTVLEDVRSPSGALLLSARHQVTAVMAERLKAIATAGRVNLHVTVLDPADADQAKAAA